MPTPEVNSQMIHLKNKNVNLELKNNCSVCKHFKKYKNINFNEV